MTAVRICNQALIKNNQFETLTEGDLTAPVSKSAILCAELYANCRREILRLAPWTCARKRINLVNAEWAADTDYELDDQIAVDNEVYTCTSAGTSDSTEPAEWTDDAAVTDGTVEWTFGHTLLKAVSGDNLSPYSQAYAVPADFIRQVNVLDSSCNEIQFVFENSILYTDDATPILVYIYDATDPLYWDPLLIEAVVMQLASKLAYPLTGSHENAIAFSKSASAMAQAAVIQTKREVRPGATVSDSWVSGLFPERKA